jgi:hypothetical protein
MGLKPKLRNKENVIYGGKFLRQTGNFPVKKGKKPFKAGKFLCVDR